MTRLQASVTVAALPAIVLAGDEATQAAKGLTLSPFKLLPPFGNCMFFLGVVLILCP